MRIRNLIGAAAFLLAAPPVWAAEGDIVLPSFSQTDWYILFGVLASSFVGLGYGSSRVRKWRREPAGTERMQEISAAIEEGAMAYLGRQFRTMIWFVLALAVVLWLIYRPVYTETPPHAKLPLPFGIAMADRKSVVSGKSVDLGGPPLL